MRSHSGKADFLSRGNDLADARANRERETAAANGDRGQNFLFNEERVIAYVQWPGRMWEEHVIGDVGRACREWMRREMFQSWASLPHQGRVAKVAGIAEVRELCKEVRRSMDSAALLDLTLALCEWMPVGRQVGRRPSSEVLRARAGNLWACPGCSVEGDETSQHRLLCSASEASRWALAARLDQMAVCDAPRPDRMDLCLFALTEREMTKGVCDAAARVGHKGGASDETTGLVRDMLRRPAPQGQGLSVAGMGLAVAEVLARRSCPCGMPGSSGHVGCVPPIQAQLASQLRSAFCLDTDLFSAPQAVRAGFGFWGSFGRRDIEAGGCGSPWDLNWAGRFSLVAPWLPHGQVIAHRCLRRAAAAIRNPRPTRVILVLRGCCVELLRRLKADVICPALPGDPSVAVVLLQNSAAAEMCPARMCDLPVAMRGGRQMGKPLSGEPQSPLRGRYAEPTPVFVPCRALPFVTGSLPRAPAELPRHLWKPMAALTAHDRYAGLLGLLPRGYESLLAWGLAEAGLSLKSAFRCAAARAREMRMALFHSSRKVFRAADAYRRVWLGNVEGPEAWAWQDAIALAAHCKSRAETEKRFAIQCERARARRTHSEAKKYVADRTGVSVRTLLRLYPGWTVASAPREHANFLVELSMLTDPAVQCGWSRENGRLRPSSRSRRYDDGTYILLPEELRASRRRGSRSA